MPLEEKEMSGDQVTITNPIISANSNNIRLDYGEKPQFIAIKWDEIDAVVIEPKFTKCTITKVTRKEIKKKEIHCN